MTKKKLKRTMRQLVDEDAELSGVPVLLADGFDDALIGVAWQFNKKFAVYDRDKCISILVTRDRMTVTEAEEYFEFNTQNAYVGENTPAFMTRGPALQLESYAP